MRTVGVDLGLRSAYFAILDEAGTLTLHSTVLKPKKHSRVEELRAIVNGFQYFLWGQDQVRIEEPVVAGARNLRTSLQIAQTCGALLAHCPADTVLVPVSSWKKATTGKGNASKEDVSAWLKGAFPDFWYQCEGDQNLIDATCIALSRHA